MEHALNPGPLSPVLPIMVGPGYENKWVMDLANEMYHHDRSAISSSGLKVLLQQTPAHFREEWLHGISVDKEKEHFRFGALAHMALIEPDRFRSKFVLEPVFEGYTKDGELSTRSKEAREKKKEWYDELDAESIVVTEKDYKDINGIIASVLAHDKASKVIKGASIEMSGFFREPITQLKCRIRPDILHLEKKVLVDVKTARDGSARFFGNEIVKHLYNVSLAFYGMGIKAITGWEPEVYALLVLEKEPPYAVALYTVKRDDIETAKAWTMHGLETLKRCIEVNKWPAHQEGQAEDIAIPNWFNTKELPLYDFGDELS